jgi:hypothetical protein
MYKIDPKKNGGAPLFKLCDLIIAAGFPVSIHLGIIYTSIRPSILWLTSPCAIPFPSWPTLVLFSTQITMKKFRQK